MGRAYRSQLRVPGPEGKGVQQPKIKPTLTGKDTIKSPRALASNGPAPAHVDMQIQGFEQKQLLNNYNNAQKMSEVADTFRQARLKLVKSQKDLTPRAA